MIYDIEFENMYSFKEKVVFSMEGTETNAKNQNYFRVNDSDKCLKVGVIYGANASGKTNLIRGLYGFQLLLKEGNNRGENDGIKEYMPFGLHESSINAPSSLKIRLLGSGNILYTYKLRFNAEKILEESYQNYEEYSKKYLEENKKQLGLNEDNMKSLVLEINNIEEYDKKNYPFYKYFFMTTYPSKSNFIEELKKVHDFKRKYPLITSYLINENKQKDLIKYLPDFNNFANFMIDNYSYKISREEASKQIIKDEEIYKNGEHSFKNMFDKFKEIWAQLMEYADQFGNRDKMPIINLDENSTLAYFLNDDGEIGKGMYIAAAYQNFINWQNKFLDELIEPYKQSGILHHFVKNMVKTIY
jgi:AAA15 family ATPase/GTPase